MSDKNRNMNDINDQKTAEQQAFSEEIRRRLAEPDSGKPTLDEFKVMVYKDREKRRKKRNALVACIVAAFIVGCLTYDDLVPEVGADKNPKETIKTEDGVIIEDGGWGSSTGEDDVLVIEAWKNVKEVGHIFPEILVPSYVPDGYIFKTLTIDSTDEETITYEYMFEKRNISIEIEINKSKTSIDSLFINDADEVIITHRGRVYLQSEEIKKATILLEDGSLISMWYEVSNNEALKIIDGLEKTY